MNRTRNLAGAAAAACLLLAGCLTGETTHTFYLHPDGSLRWSVLERNIRSDEKSSRDRAAEEQEYLAAAYRGDHPVARALALLRPAGLETEVIRPRRPFTVLTEADFGSPAELARAVLDALEVRGDAWMENDGTLVRFVLQVDSGQEAGEEVEEELGALMAELEEYRIHLTDGRFVDAVGFRIEGQGDVAVPEEVDDDGSGLLVYSLTWSADPSR